MNGIPWIWLIALPLFTSPLVYLVGRLANRLSLASQAAAVSGDGSITLGGMPRVTGLSNRQNPAKWVGLVVLLATWAPFIQAWQAFSAKAGQALTFQYGGINLRLDGISLLMAAAILTLGTLAALFSGAYLQDEESQEKFYTQLNVMIAAMLGLVCAADLFNLWVWFELMAITSYMLVAFYSTQRASLEAGVKYLVQSATGSVLVLLGIALVFSQTGVLGLDQIQTKIAAGSPSTLLLLAAGALFIIGFGVKVALVPLHTWLPDAHSQAPSGISAMLSGVVIETGLVALLRAVGAIANISIEWGNILLIFGAVNMLLGNLMALRQTQVKRLLAYSSLSHIGYILLGLGIAVKFHLLEAAQGGFFHILTHSLMKGLAFLAVGSLLYVLYVAKGQHGPLVTTDLAGAAKKYPWAALCLSIALLGLGGLPPLAGFMSKWQIFAAGFQTQNPWIIGLVIFAALNSVLSLGYYAPLVNLMYRGEGSTIVKTGKNMPLTMIIPLIILAAAVIILGFYPTLVNGLTGPAGFSLMTTFGIK